MFFLLSTQLSSFSSQTFIILGKNWASFSILPCNECCHRAKRRQASLDWPPYRFRRVLLWLWWTIGLEVWKSLWNITEVQGRKVHTWKGKNCQGELVALPFAPLFTHFSLDVASSCLTCTGRSYPFEIFHCFSSSIIPLCCELWLEVVR